MKIVPILQLFLAGVFKVGCFFTWSTEIEVSISPTKTEYLLGEPVACNFLLKNNSQKILSLVLEYPGHMGLSFSEEAESAKSEFPMPGGRIKTTKIDPGQEFGAKIILNRYMTIRPGKHKVSFAALFRPVFNMETLTANGGFEFSVSNKAISSVELKIYCEEFNDNVSKNLREAIEVLLWVDDASVVPCLIRAAKILPAAGPDVVRAMAKFLNTNEGRKGFWSIASLDPNTLAMAYGICGEKKILPPVEFLQSNMDSPDNGKRWHTISFLIANGDKSHVPLIQKSLNDPEDCIRQLAKKGVENLVKIERMP